MLEFTLPIEVCVSKKNRTYLNKGAKHPVVRSAEKIIALIAQRGRKHFGDAEIEVDIEWDVPLGVVKVKVWPVAAKPKKGVKSGRARDVVNIPAIILDAMNDVAYDDDRQVKKLTVSRVY